ncbi:MAG: hypothetical protein ACI4QA_02500 [Candidatus Spyradosoma sp.]
MKLPKSDNHAPKGATKPRARSSANFAENIITFPHKLFPKEWLKLVNSIWKPRVSYETLWLVSAMLATEMITRSEDYSCEDDFYYTLADLADCKPSIANDLANNFFRNRERRNATGENRHQQGDTGGNAKL